MRFQFKSRLEHKALIDITSLIDLVFLLVAFFMITSSLGSESTIEINLPNAVQTGKYDRGKIILSVNNKDEIFLKDKRIFKKNILNELKKIKQSKKELPVVIRGDKKSSYEMIVFLIDSLNRAGISKFTISAIKK